MTQNEGMPRAEAIFTAVAYGDAAGLPVETMHADDIAERYGYIRSLIPPTDNPFFKGEYPVGTTSDDTQLTLAVAESLVEAGAYEQRSQADRHLAAYHRAPRIMVDGSEKVQGWGGSTTRSLDRIEQGIDPMYSGERSGAGNGVVMKLAPLALWNTLTDANEFKRASSYDLLTDMTHDSDIARITTQLHGEVLRSLMVASPMSETIRAVLDSAPGSDRFTREFSMIKLAVAEPCRNLEGLIERYAAGKSGFDYGFYVPETLAMAYDIYSGYCDEPEAAIYTAVNLGGDSDSIASIVASMLASDGHTELPSDYDKIQDLETIHEKAAAFERAAEGEIS